MTHQEQPLPVVNDQEFVHDRVAAALLARKEIGIERYGTGLQPYNGRFALRDAYEEILDLTVYFQQHIDEQTPAAAVANTAWHAVMNQKRTRGVAPELRAEDVEPLTQLIGSLGQEDVAALTQTIALIHWAIEQRTNPR